MKVVTLRKQFVSNISCAIFVWKHCNAICLEILRREFVTENIN